MDRVFKDIGCLAALLIIMAALIGCIERKDAVVKGETVEIFKENVIHFDADQPDKYATDNVSILDNGRVVMAEAGLPELRGRIKITAHVAIHPIPEDEVSVYDRWDRAGNVRLVREGRPDIEIVKFVTAYGGFTEYNVDVSHLAPLLRGDCVFKGFVDTWMSPGWKMDFSLTFTPHDYVEMPIWVEAAVYEESFDFEGMGDEGVTVDIDIPDGLKQVIMNYLVSGHCTDGRDADEFVSKDNVIYVDGREVYRFRPWRDDCLKFRAINPYCRRWSDGAWSSDYSRSGWCPGDKVEPTRIDLTPYLEPGRHSLRFAIEKIRPKDELGHYGYWRVSGHLVGFAH